MGGRTPAARKAKPAQLVTGKRKRAGSPAGSPLTRSVTRKAALNAQPSDSDDDDDDEDQPPAVPRGRVHANTNKTAGSPQKRSKPIANGVRNGQSSSHRSRVVTIEEESDEDVDPPRRHAPSDSEAQEEDDEEEDERAPSHDGDDDDDDDDEPAPAPKRRKDNLGLLQSSATRQRATTSRQMQVQATPAHIHATPRSRPITPRAIMTQDDTPFQMRYNPRDRSKPLLSLMTPKSKGVGKQAQKDYVANIFAKAPFPTEEQRMAFTQEAIHKAIKDLDLPSRERRYKDNPEYAEQMQRLVKPRDSHGRGQWVSFSRARVVDGFGIGAARGPPQANRRYVELLLADDSFIFNTLEWEMVDESPVEIKKRRGPYRSPVIVGVVRQVLFQPNGPALSPLTASLFDPIPLEVIALATTAVQCALHDWLDGVPAASATEFTADQWSPVYKRHLRTLRRLQTAKPLQIDAWLRRLWANCWACTPQALEPEPEENRVTLLTEEEMNDFDDVGLEV